MMQIQLSGMNWLVTVFFFITILNTKKEIEIETQNDLFGCCGIIILPKKLTFERKGKKGKKSFNVNEYSFTSSLTLIIEREREREYSWFHHFLFEV